MLFEIEASYSAILFSSPKTQEHDLRNDLERLKLHYLHHSVSSFPQASQNKVLSTSEAVIDTRVFAT